MNYYHLKYIVFLLFFITIAQLSFSQNIIEINSQKKSINTYFNTSNWEKVIEEGSAFFSNFGKRKPGPNDSLLNILSMKISYQMAVANAFLGKMETASKFAKIEIVKDSLSVNQKYYKHYYQYASSGCISLIDNKFNESVKNLDLARNIAFDQLSTNRNIYLDATKNLVAYYIESLEFDKAKKELLHILTHIESEKTDSLLLAEIYYNMFLVYYSDKDYPSALQCSETSLSFLKDINRQESGTLLAKVNQAVGISYFQMGQYNQAKVYLQTAIDIHENYFTQKNPEAALAYNYLGRVYRMLLNTDLAIENKTKASNIFNNLYKSNNSFWSIYVDPFLIKDSETKQNKKNETLNGHLYELLTDFNYVFTHLPARYMKSATTTRGNKDNSKVYSFASQENYEKLIPLFKGLLRNIIKQANSGQISMRFGYEVLADMFLAVNQLDSATTYYTKALNEQLVKPLNIDEHSNKSLSNFKLTPQLLKTFSSIANCYYKVAEFSPEKREDAYKAALDFYLKSDSLAEDIGHYFNNDQDKLVLTQQMHEVYNSVIDILFKLASQSDDNESFSDYLQKAFLFSQKSKTNELKELIIKSNATEFKGVHRDNIKKELSLRKKITFIKRQKKESINDFELLYYYEKFDKTNISNRDSNLLENYKSERTILTRKLNKAFQNYYEFRYDNNELSINEIQARLKSGSILLDYHLNDSILDIFVIDNKNFLAKRVVAKDLTSSFIENYIDILSGFNHKNDFMQYGYPDYIKYGKKLYDYLIKPIEPSLKNHKKLILIVNQKLSLLPFETLLIDTLNHRTKKLESLNYLIKRFDIVYNYSCKLWQESLQKSREYNSNTSNLLAVAPVFDQEQMVHQTNKRTEANGRERSMSREFSHKLSPLRATKKAVEEICQIAKTKRISSFKRLYDEANEPQFKKDVLGKKYILIATHGKSDPENPQLSGLYFSPVNPESQELDQAFMFSHEAYQLNLSCEMVVLYACKTGVGKIKKEYGPMSVSRGFMASGSANVVHTLWSINDLSTRDLVVEMYKCIFNNESYSSSLRKSKLKMLELGIMPYHWSGLVLLGN